MRRLSILAWSMAAVFSLETKAANITPIERDGVVRGIVIEGTIVPGDHQKFVAIALTTDKAVVFLRSDGGSIIEAFEIGRAIRLKGFPTSVVANDVCASACALVWLAGTPRHMGSTAKIGFHAAYTETSGAKEISSSGNAIVGSYLTTLGLSEAAIFAITSAAPNEVDWVSPARFEKLGIEVKVEDFGTEQAKTSPGTIASGVPSKPLEAQATSFLVQYLSFENAESARSINLVATAYADTVSYFGKLKSKQDVLVEYSRFIERWPSRKYALKPSGLNVSCSVDKRQCLVDALIEWDVSSPGRNARSQGVSTWHLALNLYQGNFSITSIDGKVIQRNISKLNSERGLCLGLLCLFDPDSPDTESSSEAARATRRALRVLSSVSEGVLNMRDGPGIRHALIVAVPAGSSLWQVGACVKADDDISRYKWCNVEWNGRTGWASASGLETALEDR